MKEYSGHRAILRFIAKVRIVLRALNKATPKVSELEHVDMEFLIRY